MLTNLPPFGRHDVEALCTGTAYRFRMPKTIQLHAPITYYSLAVPTDCKMMSSDADDRAQPSGLVSVPADPHDAVAKRQPTSRCSIHDLSPGAKQSQLVRWYMPPLQVPVMKDGS
jgi:hypothetical protein